MGEHLPASHTLCMEAGQGRPGPLEESGETLEILACTDPFSKYLCISLWAGLGGEMKGLGPDPAHISGTYCESS